jgi:hypothetical protein
LVRVPVTGNLSPAAAVARIRFEMVMRLTQKRPDRDFALMCVKPKKLNVSGLP